MRAACVLALLAFMGGWWLCGALPGAALRPPPPPDLPGPDPRAPEGPGFYCLHAARHLLFLSGRAATRGLFLACHHGRRAVPRPLRAPAGRALARVATLLAPVRDYEVEAMIRLMPGHFANVPTLIQASNSAQQQNSFSTLICNLPHATLSGNCLVLYVQTGAATTFTITDDGGNTWNNTPVDSSTTGQNLYIFVLPNAAAGTKKVTVTFAAAQVHYQGGLSEWNNVATTSPVDTHANGTGSVATPGTGNISLSMTTGTAGDLIFVAAVQNTMGDDLFLGNSFAADANGTLAHGELWNGTASYWAVQSSSGAFTATITVNQAAASANSPIGWQLVGVALKSAAAGTPLPNTPRVRRRQFQSGTTAGTVRTVQQPCATGSLVVYSTHASANAGQDARVLSVADQGNNNFFVAANANHFTSGGLPVAEAIWYSYPASAVTPVATVTWNAAQEQTVATYEIVGPCDTLGATVTATGNQLVAGGFTSGSITPTQKGGVVITVLPIEVGTINATTAPSATAFDGWSSSGMQGGFNFLEEDNGHSTYVSPSTAAQTYSWTIWDATQIVGSWGWVAAEFVQGNRIGWTKS